MLRLFSDLKQDLRHAARVFASKPAIGTIAVGTLILGIGVSTGVFSVFNAVMISGLPFRDPERLVMLWNVNEKAGFDLKTCENPRR